ncbi:MAG: DNA gyrase inhibitor YacG [Burkholderiaceae bacterium]
MGKVRCPTCAREVRWDAQSKFRPFCSERCKMIDLGAWASDGYSIAGDGESNVGAEDADNKSDASSRSH